LIASLVLPLVAASRYLPSEINIKKIKDHVNRNCDNKCWLNKIYKNIFENRKSLNEVSDFGKSMVIMENQNKRLSLKEESKNILNNIGNQFDLNNTTTGINSYSPPYSQSDKHILSAEDVNETNQNITYTEDINLTSNNIISYNTDDYKEQQDVNMKQIFKGFESHLIQSEIIRNQYYSKLILHNIWEMEKRNHNSIFIFDWDDTILTTSYITPNGFFCNDYKMKATDYKMFEELDSNATILLNLAIAKGKTFIVTNAVSGWVEMSAKIFLPEVAKLLKYINIISARDSFENSFPGNCRKWKIETFLEIQKCFKAKLITNLICIGDSIIEMEAAHIISKKFISMFLKTVKFVEKPKPEEVIKELKLVIKNFDMIFTSIKSLTINVEKKFLKKKT